MSGGDGETERAASAGRCPICGKAGAHAFRPFCSKRCADVDLGRWLTGSYAIPVEPGADEDEDGFSIPQDGGADGDQGFPQAGAGPRERADD